MPSQIASCREAILQVSKRYVRRPVKGVQRRQIKHKDVLAGVTEFLDAGPIALELTVLVCRAATLVPDDEREIVVFHENVNRTLPTIAVDGDLASHRRGLEFRQLVAAQEARQEIPQVNELSALRPSEQIAENGGMSELL